MLGQLNGEEEGVWVFARTQADMGGNIVLISFSSWRTALIQRRVILMAGRFCRRSVSVCCCSFVFGDRVVAFPTCMSVDGDLSPVGCAFDSGLLGMKQSHALCHRCAAGFVQTEDRHAMRPANLQAQPQSAGLGLAIGMAIFEQGEGFRDSDSAALKRLSSSCCGRMLTELLTVAVVEAEVFKP